MKKLLVIFLVLILATAASAVYRYRTTRVDTHPTWAVVSNPCDVLDLSKNGYTTNSVSSMHKVLADTLQHTITWKIVHPAWESVWVENTASQCPYWGTRKVWVTNAAGKVMSLHQTLMANGPEVFAPQDMLDCQGQASLVFNFHMAAGDGDYTVHMYQNYPSQWFLQQVKTGAAVQQPNKYDWVIPRTETGYYVPVYGLIVSPPTY